MSRNGDRSEGLSPSVLPSQGPQERPLMSMSYVRRRYYMWSYYSEIDFAGFSDKHFCNVYTITIFTRVIIRLWL